VTWTDDDIEAHLRAFLGQRTRWPARRDFEEAGESRLIRRVYRRGGARYWATRLGVAYPPDRCRPESAETFTRPDVAKAETKLARLRLARGISRGHLARRAGMSESTVKRLERGHQPNPPFRHLVNLALVLEVPIEAIVEDEWREGTRLSAHLPGPRGTAPLTS
jgi:DNA-binding XRE family transcriptional regulator